MSVIFFLLMIPGDPRSSAAALSTHDTPMSCEIAKQQAVALRNRDHNYICVKGVK